MRTGPPRIGQKMCSRSTPSHACPRTWDVNRQDRGAQTDPGSCRKGCPGPLPPYIGHCRRKQKVAARSQSDLYLDILWANTRGYHHDSTRRLPSYAAHSKSALKSFRFSARGSLCNAPAPEIVQKNELEFKHGKLWKMAADLFDCAGLRLGSSSCKLQALA